MKIAFASDFDNTLYFKDHFRTEDIDAIRAFQERGYHFGVCTGRSLNGVLIPSKNQIHYDFYIIASGALILDENCKSIHEDPLYKEDILDLYEIYNEEYPIALLSKTDFLTINAGYSPCIHIDYLDEIPDEIYGLSFFARDEKNAREIKQHIELAFPNLKVHQNRMFLDIVKKGNSKGNALGILKEKCGYDIVSCMGDSYNDMSMLEASPHSFTFHNSPEEVKNKAKYLCSSLDEALTKFK